MSVAALAVSIIALMVSSISVGWNIYSWVNSGARGRVSIDGKQVQGLTGVRLAEID